MNPTLAELQTLPDRLREQFVAYEHLIRSLTEHIAVLREELELKDAVIGVLDEEIVRLQQQVKS